jgi:mRNA interferase RelE/StbE
MTPFRVRYTPAAAESIRHLHPSVKQAVRQDIRKLAANPLLGHPLALELVGFRSLRISRYRVIYRLQESEHILEVHLVGARREIYEAFRELLMNLPLRFEEQPPRRGERQD